MGCRLRWGAHMKTSKFSQLLLSVRSHYQLSFQVGLYGFLLLVLVSAALTQSAVAAAGDLDTTFGNRGRVLSNFGDGQGSNDFASAIALQPDGKIVTAGYRFFGNTADGADMLIARYNSDGTLDSSFGSGGKVTTDFGLTEVARGVVIQPDGKILVAGDTYALFPVFGEFALARYTSNGSLDTSFGRGGMVTSFFGDEGCSANSVALQADGKIVVAGEKTITFIFGDEGSDLDFAVARYNTDGSLDSTFGSGGVATTDFF